MNEVPPVTGDWIRGKGERAQRQGTGSRDQGTGKANARAKAGNRE
jgi:hypothetical protein